MIFIDLPFGPNFDSKKPEDLVFIDYIHELDEQNMATEQIKPTQMLAVLCKKTNEKNQGVYPLISPKLAIRKSKNH